MMVGFTTGFMDNLQRTPKRRSSKMRSSREARRLIRAYVRRYGTEREAARALHMTQAALNGMKSGRLGDTLQMQVALARAEHRARRAWLRIDQDDTPMTINAVATLRAAQRALGQAQNMIDAILKERRD